MPAHKRTPHEIARDRLEISELYLKGETQLSIASILARDPKRGYTLTRQSITYDIQVIQKAWVAESVQNMDAAKARELAKIDHLEREYWKGWERSKHTMKKSRTEQTVNNGTSAGTSEIIERQRRVGDPTFLDGVQKCIERRCKILGLDAPDKYQVDDRRLVDRINWDKVTPEQLARIDKGDDPEKIFPELSVN